MSEKDGSIEKDNIIKTWTLVEKKVVYKNV